MKSLLWTGKLTLPVRLLINANNILAWMNGNWGNKAAMKERVKGGYEGEFSDHVAKYDKLAGEYQNRTAVAQIEGIDFAGKEIIDIGCGTGIMAMLALDRGASRAICGDISGYMLKQAREKADLHGYDSDRIQFCQLDAESLPSMI